MNHSTIVLKAKFQNIFQRTLMKKGIYHDNTLCMNI